MRRRNLLLHGVILSSLALTGCRKTARVQTERSNTAARASTIAGSKSDGEKAPEAANSADKEKDDAKKKEKERAERVSKRANLVRSLEIAKMDLAKAKTAIEDQRATNAESIDKATAERDLAIRKLKETEEKHVPVRLDRSRLELQGTSDYVKETEEELTQLELMYKESELADKTKEIVVDRAKRRLERARKSLGLQQRDVENLEKATIPVELQDLKNQLTQKSQALDHAKRQAEADMRGKNIELMKAEAEIARIEGDIALIDREEKDAQR